MKKLVMLSLLSSTALLLSACDSGSDSSQPSPAALQACAQAANCNPALAAAKGAGINPGILTNAQIPPGTGNISVASSDGSTITNNNSGGSIVTLGANQGFDASKILDAKNGINYENAVSTLNNAISTGNKSASAASQAYESSNEGAAGAK